MQDQSRSVIFLFLCEFSYFCYFFENQNFYVDVNGRGVDPMHILWGKVQPCHTTLVIIDSTFRFHTFRLPLEHLQIIKT
jgi:hypothetical protein